MSQQAKIEIESDSESLAEAATHSSNGDLQCGWLIQTRLVPSEGISEW